MNSGIIGEYYVIADLMRRDFQVLTNPDPKQEGWDIIIPTNVNGLTTNKKIQIKTIDWKQSNRAVQGDFTGDFDFIVLVILNFYKSTPYITFIIPKSDILSRPRSQKRGLLCNISKKLLYTNRTMTFTTFTDKSVRNQLNKQYRNSWWRI